MIRRWFGSAPGGGGGGGAPSGAAGGALTGTYPDPGLADHAPSHEAGGADPITNLGAVDFAFKEGADNWVEIIDDPDSAGNPRLRILNPATGDAYVEAGLVSTGFPGISIKDGGSVAAEISETRIVLGDPAGAPLFSALMNDGVYLSDGAQSRVRLDATTGGITLADSTGIGSGDRVAILPDGTGLILYNASGDPIWSLADDGSLGGTAPNDGDVATWDDGAGKWVAAAAGGGSGLLQSATVHYTAATLHTFATDGAHTLVVAPGAGKMIVPVRVVYEYKFGTVPFGATTVNGDLGGVFALGPSAFSMINSYQRWPQRELTLATPSPAALGIQADFLDVTDFNVAFGPDDLIALAVIDSPSCTFGQGAADVSVRRTELENKPLLLESGLDFDLGICATVTISAAGTGYVVNDTLQAFRDFPSTDIYGTDHFSPTFKVTTVGGGGAVTGVTMLDAGEVPAPSGVGTVYSLDASSTGVSPQPGAGSGLQLTVASMTQGDGDLYVTVDYRVIDLH